MSDRPTNPFGQLDPAVRIVFEFSGGPRDGQVMASDSENEEEAMIVRGWHSVHLGQIGKRFRGMSDHGIETIKDSIVIGPDGPRLTQPIQFHEYRIVGRRDEGSTIVVQYQYVEST